MKKTKLLGLTGGIGSGKSLVAKIFAEIGYLVIDLDQISHSLTIANGEAMPAIESIFGKQVLDQCGGLDRQQMRKLLLSNEANKQQLQNILHPLIRQKTQQIIVSKATCVKGIVIEIPLLVESGYWRSIVDAILVVDCEQDTQINRVVQRSNWTREQAESIIAKQATREQRLAIADYIITNENLTMQQLAESVKQLAKQIFK